MSCQQNKHSYNCWVPPFSNRKINGTLIIQKVILGPRIDQTFNYIISPAAGGVANISITTVGGSGSATITNITSGFYTITEIPPSGFVALAPNPRTIFINEGQTIITTFNNVAIGTLIINKGTTNGNGSFTFNINPIAGGTGSVSITTNGTGSISIPNVFPSSYSITEIVPAGWTVTLPNPKTTSVPALGIGTVNFANTFGNP